MGDSNINKTTIENEHKESDNLVTPINEISEPPTKRRFIDSGEVTNEENEDDDNNPIVVIKTPFKDDINYVDFEAERDILNLSIIQYIKTFYKIDKEDNSPNDVQVKVNVSFKLLKKINGKRKVINYRKNILQMDYDNIYN